MNRIIKIVVDTNICHMGNQFCDYREFSLGKKIETLIEWIECLRLTGQVKIVFPEMVIKELVRQRVDQHKKKREELLNLVRSNCFPDIEVSVDAEDEFDYEKYITKVIDQVFSNNAYLERNMPCPLYAEKLIERAVYKRQPFEGIRKQSDKGFKDAVIWESILEYKERNLENEIVFYTADNMFGTDLIIEYKEKYNENLYVYKQEEDLLEYLFLQTDVDNTYAKKTMEKYSIVKQYLDDNISEVMDLYVAHHKAGAWWECIDVDVLSIRRTDLYLSDDNEGNGNESYEAIFWVESRLCDTNGEWRNLNLNFIVAIYYISIDDIQIRTVGSTVMKGLNARS